jgi:hypothetical protein
MNHNALMAATVIVAFATSNALAEGQFDRFTREAESMVPQLKAINKPSHEYFLLRDKCYKITDKLEAYIYNNAVSGGTYNANEARKAVEAILNSCNTYG